MSALPAPAGPALGSRVPARIVLFRLDGRRYAIDAEAVVEILAAVATSPLPRQPAYVAGLIDVRGTLVPVIDLRVRFALPHRLMELSDHFIVVRALGRTIALWVDDVEAFAPCEPHTVNPAGGLIAGDRSLDGVVLTGDGLATIHDVSAFIAQCEADAVFENPAR